MKIILEGPDNAGKSTLANYLSSRLGLRVIISGGPSKYLGEVNERSRAFNDQTEDAIYDRHPCVSQNIYQEALMLDGELVEASTIQDFYEQKPLIIYCRNAGDTTGHVLSEHSSAEYFKQVEENYPRLIRLYDGWALNHANMIYRIGDDMEALVGRIREVFNPWLDIENFHFKFMQTYHGKPRQLPAELQRFRENFMSEELGEYLGAVTRGQYALNAHQRGELMDEAEFLSALELQADSLVDLVYVALGTAYFHGFDFPTMWARVQAANMAKVLKTKEGVVNEDTTETGRDPQFDIVKPRGWQPPSHIDLIEDHAHRVSDVQA